METNQLYPIFLKVSQLNVLIVGGGNVAHEKLSFLLKSSPDAQVELVAKAFNPEVLELARTFNIKTNEKEYHENFLKNKHVVIAATDSKETNAQVHTDAKARNLLINVADTPDLCDFYLGGIVTKGNVKIAISTNGKSPTLAKRLREVFEEILPDDLSDLAESLNVLRNQLNGNFQTKVDNLNRLTQRLLTFNRKLN